MGTIYRYRDLIKDWSNEHRAPEIIPLESRWSVAAERAPYTLPLASLVRLAEARLETVWAGKRDWCLLSAVK